MGDSDQSEYDTYRMNLAEEQTRLARERTILSHIRTGFASFLFGIAIFGLFGDVISNLVDGFFILIGTVFLMTGGISYVKSNRRTRKLIDEFERPFRRH